MAYTAFDLANMEPMGEQQDVLDLESLLQADPELLKLFRQQAIAQAGESALAGIGPNAKEVPLVDVSGNILDRAINYGKKLGTGKGTVADYGTTLAGLMALRQLMQPNQGRKFMGYSGPGINMGLKAQRQALPQPAYQPYTGQAVMGRQFAEPVTYAATGGIMGLAEGGKPRYLQGETDGMADKIDTSIDGKQPAKLSHGEFVIPADVVSHLGNGNSDAGAKVLYKMMDRVRQARTGRKQQGKEINPEKFTPGGIAGYAGGGAVAFADGGATSTESNLASWAGPYVTDYLSKGQALANMPYQAYTGPLTAGASPLQQQAYSGLSTLGTPTQFGTATQLATQAAQAAQNLSYTPTTFSSGYQAPAPYTTASADFKSVSPTTISSGYVAPGEYTPTGIASKFVAPEAYQAAKFDTGLGPVGSVQSYMSPYMQSVVDIQAREARRQADISRGAEQARLAQAGAYGGSRQAIMEAERQRNLGTQIGDIQEKGLQAAYDRALAQRAQEAGLGLQAQQMGEASRQFGATQAMQAAQIGAQLGLDADKANEMARQFAYGQKMSAAEIGARFNLTAAQANQAAQMQSDIANQQAQQTAAQRAEMSRQFGASQAARAAEFAAQQAMEAQRASEASRQFGAQYGLQGLGQQLAAAQALSGIGTQQFGAGLQGLQAQLAAGAQQQAQEQKGLDALYQQWQNEMQYPYKQLQFQQSLLQGLPVGAYQQAPAQNTLDQLLGTSGGLLGLYNLLNKVGG